MFKHLTFRSDGAFWPMTEPTHHTETARSVGRFLAILTVPRRLALAAFGEFKARRAMQSLVSLDDRMLRDIGIERCQQDRLEIRIEIGIGPDTRGHLNSPRSRVAREHRIEHRTQRENIRAAIRRPSSP